MEKKKKTPSNKKKRKTQRIGESLKDNLNQLKTAIETEKKGLLKVLRKSFSKKEVEILETIGQCAGKFLSKRLEGTIEVTDFLKEQAIISSFGSYVFDALKERGLTK